MLPTGHVSSCAGPVHGSSYHQELSWIGSSYIPLVSSCVRYSPPCHWYRLRLDFVFALDLCFLIMCVLPIVVFLQCLLHHLSSATPVLPRVSNSLSCLSLKPLSSPVWSIQSHLYQHRRRVVPSGSWLSTSLSIFGDSAVAFAPVCGFSLMSFRPLSSCCSPVMSFRPIPRWLLKVDQVQRV